MGHLDKQLSANTWGGNSKYKIWPPEYGPIIIPERDYGNDAAKCMLVPTQNYSLLLQRALIADK